MNGRIEKFYVYDGVMRSLHAVIGLSTVFLVLTGFYAQQMEPGSEQSAIWVLHTHAGKVLTISFIGRILWGIIGSQGAKWSELWHLQTWLKFAKTRKYEFDEFRIGHDPFASLSYIAFYTLVLVMIGTGWILAGMIHGIGPLAEEFFDDLEYQAQFLDLHEWGFWAIGVFILMHLGAMAFHEKTHGVPIGQAMISGFQFRRIKEGKK